MDAAHRRIYIDLVQRVQNDATRLITGNFDYINCRGLDLVKLLNLYILLDRRYHCLTVLMFKAIHGIASTYLSDRIVINFDVNGLDTRGSDMELYLPHCVMRLFEIVLCICGANCGMIFLSLYKIQLILNHLIIIRKCRNGSLAFDGWCHD